MQKLSQWLNVQGEYEGAALAPVLFLPWKLYIVRVRITEIPWQTERKRKGLAFLAF